MPDQAFSTISSLAGPEIPARHQTLSNFLNLITSEPFDRAAALRAIEQHHELFGQGLSFVAAAGSAIGDWHADVSNQALIDLGTLVGNAELGKSSAQLESASQNTLWQRSRLAQLLTDQFAQKLKLPEADIRRMSLLAGLLGVGHQQLAVSDSWSSRAELIDLELEQHGKRGDLLGADWLSQRGFSAADCDLLRYQYESADVLNEAPQDIALVALAGRVADSLLRDCEFSEGYTSVFVERFQLSLVDMQAAAEQAYMAFRAENDLTLSAQNFHEHLALANLGEQLGHVATEAELLEVAAECFQVRQICLAKVAEEALTLSYRGDTFSLPTNQGASAITRAFQSQTVFSAGGNALVAIVDKQVLSRMAANVLWLVPTQQGVAVCSIDSEASAEAANPYLIKAFKTGIDRLLAERQADSAGMIDIDLVQNRIRELNHEVNNPLAIVQNYLKTLSLRLGPDDDAQANIKTIADEMLRIGSIINKYAEIGMEPTDVTPLNLNELLKKHCAIVQAAHPQVKFSLALDEQLPRLALPEVEFTQVLLNLLKNAAEALEAGDGSQSNAEVLLGSGQVNVNGAHFIEVVVEDNGPGIAAEIYQNLFSPNNSSKGEGHSGIGLSVVHRLITEMGGSISCRNSTAGCQFQILLPTIEN